MKKNFSSSTSFLPKGDRLKFSGEAVLLLIRDRMGHLMVRNCRQRLWQLSSIAIAVGIATTHPSSKLLAQITPDGTLGAESSVINPDVIQGIPSDRIDGGARRGSNLFHSFLEFNIRQGRAAYFSNPAAIENIFSRVTGSNPSRLLGTLGVLGNANLFFINPHGIIFGPNARLDVNGSFFGSTASSITFPDGIEFSATNPAAPPLLTVTVGQPIGLRFEGSPGTIVNQSKATDSSGQIVGLQVQPGQTIGLLGGELNLEGGAISASGGRIELGAVAVGSEVSFNSTYSGLAFGYEGVQNFEDIQLSQQAVANTSGEGGGSIQVQGGKVTLTQGSSLVAETLGSLDGGGIHIEAEQFRLSEESFVSTLTLGAGRGGDLTIRARESIELIGTGFENFEQTFIAIFLGRTLPPSELRKNALFAGTDGVGRAGDMTIETPSLLLREGAALLNATFSEGDGGSLVATVSESVEMIGGSVFATLPLGKGAAGDLTIDTGQLIVRDGAQISASTFSEGDAGDLTVTAQSVELIAVNSGLFAQVNPGASGNGGQLTIDTQRLLVSDGAQISVSTFGEGNAGNLTVTAQSVELIGIGTTADGPFASGLFAQTQGKGDGGNLTIETERLLVRDGAQVQALTWDSGDAGELTVRAQLVEVIGRSAFGSSGLFASVQQQGASGKGGKLMIETGRLLVSDGAQVSVRTFGSGDAGDLTVTAQSVEVIGTDGLSPSSLLADVRPGASGDGGNLRIETERLLVRDGAEVSANTLEGSTGNGGSIFIDSRTALIRDGSSVRVDSQGTGEGGDIQIQTGSLTLDRGAILAETNSNTGGNIALQVQGLLLLRNGSQISTTAGTAQGGGDGGNITIDAGFIVAFPSENSDITANAFTGDGGRVQITANGIFGIEPHVRLTSLSDITATSTFGAAGIVEINTPDVDPNRGLTNLPEEAVETQVAEGCQASDGQEAVAFFNLGRGGLPPRPDEAFKSETIITPWMPLISEAESDLERASSGEPPTEASRTPLSPPCREN